MHGDPVLFAQASAEAPSLVALRGIGMRFGATRAVEGVDLDLKAGEIHGLIGENGAGKSALMRVLAGFFENYEGSISRERVDHLRSRCWSDRRAALRSGR